MHFAALNPAQDLLADLAADLDDVHSILIPGGTSQLLDEVAMLHPGATIHWIPTDLSTAFITSDSVVVHNDVGDIAINQGSIDLTVLEVAGDRDLSRRWLALVRHVAKPGGVLLVAGPNDLGIKSAIGDAGEAIGPAVVEDSRRHNRVAHVAIPPVPPVPPDWALEDGIAPGTWSRFAVRESGIDLLFDSLPGVFSADHLDDGTALVLDHLDVPADASMLDVGCGSGVLGVVAGRRGAGLVTMTDINLLAIAAAERNADLSEAPVVVMAGDVYSAVGDERFDLIVSNPPFHQGKDVNHDVPQRLIAEARYFLKPGGRLVLVANAFLPYDRMMREHFREVDTLAATRQFRVLSAKR
ncbi:MAG: class I SAM-dependent methyltransferase [Chloroflexota bacterium]|nr:class I SAM-dependent methyltransferase [Chloroflexota bacterium]